MSVLQSWQEIWFTIQEQSIYMHFIRNKVIVGELSIQYVPSEEQVLDIMTKPLSFVKFNYLKAKLNVHLCPLSLRETVRVAHYEERSKEK